MKALCYTRPLGIGELAAVLEMRELSVPEPEQGYILVRMRASSINIDDIHIAEGTFLGGMNTSRASPEHPSTPGVDVAGTVVKTGTGVTGFAVGDEVLGILGFRPGRGAWAECCCLSAAMTLKKPTGYSIAQGVGKW